MYLGHRIPHLLQQYKRTLFMKLVAKVAALTRALELDSPEAGGMLPETVTNIPI